MIVSGDLTACGKQDQFRDAVLYLGAQLPFQKGHRGLDAPNWATAGIPGNHDQWPGTNKVVGHPTAGLGMTFPQMPFVKSLPPMSTGHSVTFIFINTDADIDSHSLQRRLARGCFTSELAQLDDILQAPLPREVRVLVLHHSRCYGFDGQPRKRLRMTPKSWAALNQFIVAQRIRILMTGHIHAQHVVKDSLQGLDGAPLDFMECRCGTTTVRNTIPYNWQNLFGKFPNWQLPANAAIVHRILRDADGEVVWTAEEYVLGPCGFSPAKSQKVHKLTL